MNSFLFKSHDLLTGQAVPYTGSFFPAAQARKMSFFVQSSGITGSPTLSLGYPNPIDSNSLVTVFSRTFSSNGNYHFELSGLPLPKIGAWTINNTGNFFVTVYQQN